MAGPMTETAGFSLNTDHIGERLTDKQTVFWVPISKLYYHIWKLEDRWDFRSRIM